MPLYCYMISDTVDYDETNIHIVAHRNKYTPKEFHDICMKILNLYGHSTGQTTSDGVFVHVDPEWLIHLLKINHYFIPLDLPFFDTTQHKKVYGPKVGDDKIKVMGKWVTLEKEKGNQ